MHCSGRVYRGLLSRNGVGLSPGAESAFRSTLDHRKIGVRRFFLAILATLREMVFGSGPALRYNAREVSLAERPQANFTQRRQAAKKAFLRFSGSLRENQYISSV